MCVCTYIHIILYVRSISRGVVRGSVLCRECSCVPWVLCCAVPYVPHPFSCDLTPPRSVCASVPLPFYHVRLPPTARTSCHGVYLCACGARLARAHLTRPLPHPLPGLSLPHPHASSLLRRSSVRPALAPRRPCSRPCSCSLRHLPPQVLPPLRTPRPPSLPPTRPPHHLLCSAGHHLLAHQYLVVYPLLPCPSTRCSSTGEHRTAHKAGGADIIARGTARLVDRNPPNGRRCQRSTA